MEEIARRNPINRTAARVVQPGPKGVDLNKRASSTHGSHAAPWPVIPVPRHLADLSGMRVGSLTVVGLSAIQSGHRSYSRVKRARWVCRCVCGYYVLRSKDSIANTKNDLDACDRCLHRQFLQQRERRKVVGDACRREGSE